jgi:hypothetical protein
VCFTNHFTKIGNEICDEKIPFSILHPLITESQKIMNLPPALAQTGPAIRNDENNRGATSLYLMKIN